MLSAIAAKLALALLAAAGILGLAVLAVAVLSFFLGDAPFLATSKPAAVRTMEVAAIQEGEKVYDLGCGDGRLLVRANKEYGAQAVGVELFPPLCWLARVRALLAGADVKVIRGNIFDFDFSDADVVLCYLMPGPMRKTRTAVEKPETRSPDCLSEFSHSRLGARGALAGRYYREGPRHYQI